MKLSQKDFLEFQKEFHRWMKIYGCTSWEARFEFKDMEENDAGCTIQLSPRSAIVFLNKETERDEPGDIHRLAFHEATELMLGRIRVLAMERFLDERMLDEAFHEVIRILERVLFFKEK